MKILITGMSGLIGSATRRALENDHELTALNRSDVDGVATHRGDISDFGAIEDCVRGAGHRRASRRQGGGRLHLGRIA